MGFAASVSIGAFFASSVFIGILPLCFWVGDRLRPAWGLRWFGLVMLLTLLRALGSIGPVAGQPWWGGLAAALAAAALSAMYVGLRVPTSRNP